jgi:hypothetical protein
MNKNSFKVYYYEKALNTRKSANVLREIILVGRSAVDAFKASHNVTRIFAY